MVDERSLIKRHKAKPTYEEFKTEIRRLLELLDESETGLDTWHQQREQQMDKVSQMLRELGY